jgi:serine/threonine protein kinase
MASREGVDRSSTGRGRAQGPGLDDLPDDPQDDLQLMSASQCRRPGDALVISKTYSTAAGRQGAQRLYEVSEDQVVTWNRSQGDVSLYKLGDTIGDSYVLTGILGQGGMGVIYRARHTILRKDFALKILPPGSVTANNWKRFQAEGRSLARLSHANIVTIHNMGIDRAECPFFVMDWLPGITLAARIGDKAMPFDEVAPLFLQIASGLHSAHQCGVIHRDIKPSNIMLVPTVTGKLQVKIVDFGLARLSSGESLAQQTTAVGEVIGSPLYMSPEQCLGAAVDLRTDIYSLGCTLFEALTGQPPFCGESAFQTAMLHQMQPPPALKSVCPTGKFPAGLESLIGRMLSKSPEHRFGSMNEFAVELAQLAGLAGDVECLRNSGSSPSSCVGNQLADNSLSQGDSCVDPDRPVSFFVQREFVAAVLVVLLACLLGLACLHFAKPNSRSGNNAARWFKKNSLPCRPSPLVSDQVPRELLERIKPICAGIGPGKRGKRIKYIVNPGFPSAFEVETAIGWLPSNVAVPLPETAPITLKVGSVVLQYPQLMDKVGPEDVSAIRFDGIDENVNPVLERVSNWKRLSMVMFSSSDMKCGYLSGLSNVATPYGLFLLRNSNIRASFREVRRLDRLNLLQIDEQTVPCDLLSGLERAVALRSVHFTNVILEPGALAQLARVPKLKTVAIGYRPVKTQTAIDLPRKYWPQINPSAIAELKQLKVRAIVLAEPHWGRADLLRFVKEVPAVRVNNWTRKFQRQENRN